MTTGQIELTPLNADNKRDFSRDVVKGERGKPMLTDSGKAYGDELYYTKVLHSPDPIGSYEDLRLQLKADKDNLPKHEAKLLQAHLDQKVGPKGQRLREEYQILWRAKDGHSVWSNAYNTLSNSGDPTVDGQFASTIREARAEIADQIQKRVNNKDIEKVDASINRAYREHKAAEAVAEKLKESQGITNEELKAMVKDAVEAVKDLGPMKSELIDAIRAETFKQPEKTKPQKAREFVDKVLTKVTSAKFRRNALLTVFGAAIAFGTVSSDVQPTQTVGATGTGEGPRAAEVTKTSIKVETATQADAPKQEKVTPKKTPTVFTVTSAHEGAGNVVGLDGGGVVNLNQASVDNFISDSIEASKKDPNFLQGNRAAAQLTLPYSTDSIARGLGSKFSNGEAGLGFQPGNYEVSSLAELTRNPDKVVFQKDDNGVMRAILICDIGDIDKCAEAGAEAALKETGMSPDDPSFLTEVRKLKNQALADMGITFNLDGTISTNQARLKAPGDDGKQSEVVQQLTIQKGLENPENRREEETDTLIDANNSVALPILLETNKDGGLQRFRVEGYSAAAVVDSLNPKLQTQLSAKDSTSSLMSKIRAGLDRLLPTGKGTIQQNIEGENEQQQVINEIPQEVIQQLPPEIQVIVTAPGDMTDDEVVILANYVKNNRGVGNNLWKGYDPNNPHTLGAGVFGHMTHEQKMQFLNSADLQEIKPSLPGAPIIDPSSTYSAEQVAAAISNLPETTYQAPAVVKKDNAATAVVSSDAVQTEEAKNKGQEKKEENQVKNEDKGNKNK